MTRLPRARGREIVRALERLGFVAVRTRGSHVFLKHSDGRVTTVPVHASETIGSGLLRSILRDVELSVEELLRRL
jgi:predicted RNA binding protein YcfA (HicA-like mRNA interferase family)